MADTPEPASSIHPTLFVCATLLNLSVIKVAGYLLPDQAYFTFSAFLFDERPVLRAGALILKLLPPVVVAFFVTLAFHRLLSAQRAMGRPGGVFESIIAARQLSTTLTASAFLSALLMAWPYILMWDMLIDPIMASHRLTFLLAYFIYFAGYAWFARTGVELAEVVIGSRGSVEDLSWVTAMRHPFLKPVSTALSGALASAVATFLVASAQ